MSFINGASLAIYCPGVSEETLDAIASNVEALFCSLLPIKLQERTKKFRDDSVYRVNLRNKVNTNLLNISAIKIDGVTIDSSEFKID
jgi:hypothetical protein